MKLVKAEVLWSRTCSLHCSYCAMADGRRNTPSVHLWCEGFNVLKKFDCRFAAFYGAEPLEEFEKLPEVIHHAELIGIHTTLITSGISRNVTDKLKVLYESGLRSITASYDDITSDISSAAKTNKAMEIIDLFRSFGPVRDVAVVVTLTRLNYQNLPSIIEQMTKKGIWTFFDLIHPDRGQPGSKVRFSEEQEDLFFRREDWAELAAVLTEAAKMKETHLFHTSRQFIETIKIVAACVENTDVSPFLWKCSDYNCFPSWITVDCDGNVYPCDDFQLRSDNAPKIKLWDLRRDWDKTVRYWKTSVNNLCPGCLWNTHIDAHLIKENKLPITDYIHGIGEKNGR